MSERKAEEVEERKNHLNATHLLNPIELRLCLWCRLSSARATAYPYCDPAERGNKKRKKFKSFVCHFALGARVKTFKPRNPLELSVPPSTGDRRKKKVLKPSEKLLQLSWVSTRSLPHELWTKLTSSKRAVNAVAPMFELESEFRRKLLPRIKIVASPC